jgi:hypothetical protein
MRRRAHRRSVSFDFDFAERVKASQRSSEGDSTYIVDTIATAGSGGTASTTCTVPHVPALSDVVQRQADQQARVAASTIVTAIGQEPLLDRCHNRRV